MDTPPAGGAGAGAHQARHVYLWPVVIIVAIALVATLVGWFSFSHEAALTRRHQGEELSAIRDLKAAEISAWMAGQRSGVRSLSENAVLGREVRGWMRAGAGAPAPPVVSSTLSTARASGQFVSVAVLDGRGRRVLATPANAERDPPLARVLALGSSARQAILFSDLVKPRPGQIAMYLAAPVGGASVAARAPGSYLAHVDPEVYLYPLLRAWPTSSPSGETLLVERVGDSVVFLTPLRYRPGAALTSRLPLTSPGLPAARAVSGVRGVVTGKDYRGVPVLAAVGPVPGTPWSLVSKVDLAEVDGPIRGQALWTVGAVLVVIVAGGLLVLLLWGRREAMQFRRVHEAELAEQASEERFRAAFEHAPVGVVLTAADGAIVGANMAFCRDIGYGEEDLRGRTLAEFAAGGRLQKGAPPDEEAAEAAVQAQHEQRFVRRDGTVLWAEVSSTLVHDEHGAPAERVTVIDDVSERLAAVAELEGSERRYRSLFDNMLNGFALHEIVTNEQGEVVDYVFLEANRAFLAQTGLDPDAVIGRRVTEVIPGIENEGLIEVYGKVALGGPPLRLEQYVESLDRAYDILVFSPAERQFATVFGDVSEQRRAQLALEENRRFLEQVLDLVPDLVYIFDLDQRHNVFVNREITEVLGYTPEEVQDMGADLMSVLVHPDDAAAVSEHHRHIRELADGEIAALEYRMLRRDGGWTCLLSREAVFKRGADGAVSQFIGTAQDQTERVMAERGLRETTERLAAVVQASPISIMLLDEKGRVVLWNPAAEAMFGWGAEEVVGAEPPFGSGPSEPDGLTLAPVLAGERITGLERELRRRDGSAITVSVAAVPLGESDGHPLAVLALLEDVTERRRTVERLSWLSRLYDVLSQVNEAIVRETEPRELYRETCRILVESGGFPLAWVGAAGEDGVVRPLAVAGADQEYVAAAQYDLTRPESSVSPVSVALREGHTAVVTDIAGDPRMAPWRDGLTARGLRSCAGVPIIVKGTPVAALGLYAGGAGAFEDEETALIGRLAADLAFALEAADQDAARRAAEAGLAQLNLELEERVQARTTELEHSNRELEAFSYSVSHDLRAPLRAIDGFSLALVQDYGDRLDETAADYLARVRAASQRMGILIDDILTLSRVSRRDLVVQQVDLVELARKIEAELLVVYPGRTVELVTPASLQAFGDEHLLRILLYNLLDNAWKFSSRNPVARIELGARKVRRMTTYFVRDDGAGFDDTYADKLFTPFQRLHSSEEFPGTGIGLATVQRIARRHGGAVWAEGAVGHGATFFFTLTERTAGG